MLYYYTRNVSEKEHYYMEKKKRKIRWWAWLAATIALVAIVWGIRLYILTHTEYTRVQVVETYETKKTSKGNYEVYADGVLEYTRDGIAMLDEEGKEVWNQPCQMKEPIAEISEDTAAVADRGGTSIPKERTKRRNKNNKTD